MCSILSYLNGSREGWKVVAYKLDDTTKYFSPATGIEYPMSGRIVPPLEPANQDNSYRLCDNFSAVLSRSNAAYIADYIGYTSIFINKFSAIEKALVWSYHVKVGYGIAVIHAEVSEETFIGEYGIDGIYSGKHIHFHNSSFLPITRDMSLNYVQQEIIDKNNEMEIT